MRLVTNRASFSTNSALFSSRRSSSSPVIRFRSLYRASREDRVGRKVGQAGIGSIFIKFIVLVRIKRQSVGAAEPVAVPQDNYGVIINGLE